MRYAPRTAGTKRSVLVKALSLRPAKGHVELQQQIHKLDIPIKNYEEISNIKLQEDIKVAILLNLCPDQVTNQFDLDGKARDYKTLRDDLIQWVQVRRGRESGDLDKFEGNKKTGRSADDMDCSMLYEQKKRELQNMELEMWGVL